MSTLILASSSPARAHQLGQLKLPFQQFSPEIDESPKPGESASALAPRLAREKGLMVLEARSAEFDSNTACIISSDQTAELDGVNLEKPTDFDAVSLQLARCSGKTVKFHTALCVMNTFKCREAVTTTEVVFLELSTSDIDNYLMNEDPRNCLGGFKCEGLGISLFARISSDDPSALVGLPLIALNKILRADFPDLSA